MNFIRWLNREKKIYLSSHSCLLAVWTLTTNAKFRHNISRILPAKQKHHRGMMWNYHCNNPRETQAISPGKYSDIGGFYPGNTHCLITKQLTKSADIF